MSESALFVYGSLVLPACRTRIIGRPVPAIGARLPDYERKCLRGTPYPAARMRVGSSLSGELLRGLTASELARLDGYEGELYRRTLVNVESDDGLQSAFVYVIARAFEHRVGERDWSLEEFCRRSSG